jgi:hypothetical protein
MNVIDGELSGVFGPEAAVLAGPVIPSEYIFFSLVGVFRSKVF